MYLTYLGEVLKRAFAPTVRLTDGLQIAAASALPAASKFAGVNMPETMGNDVLSYIGAATISFITIRLFWAPYAIWKEQVANVAGLTLELSKPERLVLQELSKHRAEARAKLAAELEELQSYAFAEKWEGFARSGTAQKMSEIRKLQAAAGLSDAFDNGRRWLLTYVKEEVETPNDQIVRETQKSLHLLRLLQRHVIGDLTAEDLALRLPADTATKTQL